MLTGYQRVIYRDTDVLEILVNVSIMNGLTASTVDCVLRTALIAKMKSVLKLRSAANVSLDMYFYQIPIFVWTSALLATFKAVMAVLVMI